MRSEEPVDHLVRQGRGARALRWVLVAFGSYNVLVHAVEGRWWLALAWAGVTGALLAVQLAPRRLGTRVEADGLRVGSGTRWGRLITWDQVERLRPQGPYDRSSALVLRDGHRLLLLRGVDTAAAQALAAAHDIPVEDPTRRRSRPGSGGTDDGDAPAAQQQPDGGVSGPVAGPVDPLDDGPLDGPFRAAPRRQGAPPA